MKSDVKSLNREELVAVFLEWGEPGYRADQLLDWLYRRKARDWDEMSNFSNALREKLRHQFRLISLELVRKQGSRDTTEKFLWKLPDGALIESVLIPANPAMASDLSDRHTLCVSTQVGCAYGCKFCASGLEGWKRNLGAEEIVDQVMAVERLHEREMDERLEKRSAGRWIQNLVIMGMGEPLANYANVIKALSNLNAPWGGQIGARKITVSTSGLAPQIRQLANEPYQFRLAISLHGATDAVRSRMMPVNKKFPLAQLTAACEEYQAKKGRMITFEYILIAGVNDQIDQVQPLAALARRLHAKVNLIPYNRVEGLPWERPEETTQDRFLRELVRAGVTATLRREKGHDIDAACGQLRLMTERELRGELALAGEKEDGRTRQ